MSNQTATLAYHGMAVWNAPRLVEAILTGAGARERLYVTDTPERATRYANAQTSGKVSLEYSELGQHGAIFELESGLAIEWWSRGDNYEGSLDAVESIVKLENVRIKRVIVQPDTYHGPSSSKRALEALLLLLGDKVEVLS